MSAGSVFKGMAMGNLVFRLAVLRDTLLVRTISAEAYIPAYQAVIGAIPKPASEDYGDRIAAGNVWIAEIGGEACGVLVLEPASDHLMIYSIAVLPKRQGSGLGRGLLAFAEDQAREKGLRELRLYTNQRMARNVALYRACGFVEGGMRPHPSRPGEILLDMVKMLAPQ